MPIVNQDADRIREYIIMLRQAGYSITASAAERDFKLATGEKPSRSLDDYLSHMRLELNVICNTLPGVR